MEMKHIFLLLIAFGIFASGCISGIPTNSQYLDQTSAGNQDNYVANSSANSTHSVQNATETNTAIQNQVDEKCKKNRVYFIYSDWCSHCQKMKPWVDRLEQEGFEFIRVNAQDSAAVSDARTCLDGVAQLRYIPEFVCMGNGQDHVGEFATINEMRAFALSCNSLQ